MRQETILRKAVFDAKLPKYWTLLGTFVFLATVVGIPLIPIFLIIAWPIHRARFERLECELTDRSLNVRRGLLFREEKNIPLDKIQDVAMKEGPLLRKLGLASLSVETAGQRNPEGSDAALVGVVDAPAFRDAVLEQRDLVVAGVTLAPEAAPVPGGDVLIEIRDALHRIEGLLGRAER
jgi:putative membrane protein